jgi:hypothetical protein
LVVGGAWGCLLRPDCGKGFEVEVLKKVTLGDDIDTLRERIAEALWNHEQKADPWERQAVDRPPVRERYLAKADAVLPVVERGPEERERLAAGLWAYEGDPAVDWEGVVKYHPADAKRLRAKADVLIRSLGVVAEGSTSPEGGMPQFGEREEDH